VEAVQVTDWVQQEITGGSGARWEQWEGGRKTVGLKIMTMFGRQCLEDNVWKTMFGRQCLEEQTTAPQHHNTTTPQHLTRYTDQHVKTSDGLGQGGRFDAFRDLVPDHATRPAKRQQLSVR
jgi:hypothetical protein